ncbi:MAG TPA: glutamate--cysteine ligase [Casimicrobiaceae bacterium]|nr:glutamate--cysteine ligase [Casimicrobiaceae bacterium]
MPESEQPVSADRTSSFSERLQALPHEALTGLRRGIEKESLRVQADGALATTPHPAPLGSALTHPLVTTDFSESQLELITSVHASAEACLRELTEIHQAVYRAIGPELLWCASMPCRLPADDAIPLGRYGNSNVGRAKHVYRTGLSHRYGRRMQTISGIHYNFSLPEALSNDAYFGLIRNFRRHSWLLLYLFGASPAVCTTFVAGRKHELERLSDDTLYLPYATSLRMGRLGYQSDAQSSLAVSYNSLESYAASLQEAMTKPYPPYESIGIRNGENYLQLATTLLQMENEFYGTIRPKRRIRPGERPLHALRERGVEYVEVRLMDLDPFEPVGINAATMRLLDVYLLYCLLSASPPDTPRELAAIVRNKQRVASRGRKPGLHLTRGTREVALREWGAEVLCGCEPIAAALDAASSSGAHREALASAVARLHDPALTPSARVLQAIDRDYDKSYTRFVLAQSIRHKDAITELPLSAEVVERYASLATESLAKQREIEAADTLPFDAYLRQYLSPERLNV